MDTWMEASWAPLSHVTCLPACISLTTALAHTSCAHNSLAPRQAPGKAQTLKGTSQAAGWGRGLFSVPWGLCQAGSSEKEAQGREAPHTHPWLSGCPKAKLVKAWCFPVAQRKESLAVL